MLKTSSFLLVFLVPASLIVLTKVCPTKIHPVSDATEISEAESRRIESEERRAERKEARKARHAAKQAKEKEQRILEESERWFAENGEPFDFSENDGLFELEGNPAPGMMPLPMPPMLPNMAFGRVRDRRGFEGTDEADALDYDPDAGFDGYGANRYGNDSRNGSMRF